MRFLGNIEMKIDIKGRLFLPSIFRKQLQNASEEYLILRKDIFQDCLVLCPESTWNEELNELRSRLSKWNPKDQMIFRQFVSDVEIVSLDSNGRFLLPKRYIKLAHINQEVKVIGVDNTIEIWATELCEQPFMNPEEFSLELQKMMDNNKKAEE